MSGYMSEIFASFEGEGGRVGMPAVFLRLSGCNLACSYCDTGYARERSDSATLIAGRRESRLANPVGAEKIAGIVAASFPDYRDVRITGGEPLLQAEFVAETAELLRDMGFGLHLETNGTLPDEVGRVARLFDTITADVKLPSTQDGRSLEAEHEAFLAALARGGAARDVSVKIVVTPECPDDEVLDAFSLIARTNPRARVYLQPEFDESVPLVSGERVMLLLKAGLGWLPDVRVSLQMHKILKMR
ncbi:MAG: 7-carboxy-7-deazaguanine synthase QueE [bacterium]|jgi:organic radical activating enzyme